MARAPGKQKGSALAHQSKRKMSSSPPNHRQNKQKKSLSRQSRQSSDSGTTTLLSLPKELRSRIWEQLLEDQPINLLNDIFTQPTWTTEPPITRTCRAVREETLPLHYARTAFSFDISQFGTLQLLQRAIADINIHPNCFTHMRKVSMYGRAKGGQIDLAFDLVDAKLLDARWRRHQNSSSRGVSREHRHLVHDVEPFLLALRPMARGERQRFAIEAVVETLPQFFKIPQNRRTASFARSGPDLLSDDAKEPCDCMQLVKPA